TIEPRKNIASIIESFNILKKQKKYQNLELVIAGAKGWKYENVFSLASDSSYQKQIHFIGYVPRKDKTYIYNLAQIFLFPSYYEGFGLPVLEAQACGLPVICGLNSSLPEITQGSALYVNPYNLTELIKTIKILLNSPKLSNELIKKGLKNSQKYTWQKTAGQTLDLLTA
ncbi:glycosyltransferase family 4 protein, partial [Patescibacteria group bacterium]